MTIFIDFTASTEQNKITIGSDELSFEIEFGTPASFNTEIQAMVDPVKEVHIPINIRNLSILTCKITMNASLYCNEQLTKSVQFPDYGKTTIMPNQLLTGNLTAKGSLYQCSDFSLTGQIEITYDSKKS